MYFDAQFSLPAFSPLLSALMQFLQAPLVGKVTFPKPSLRLGSMS
jgi:hypothetical protein